MSNNFKNTTTFTFTTDAKELIEMLNELQKEHNIEGVKVLIQMPDNTDVFLATSIALAKPSGVDIPYIILQAKPAKEVAEILVAAKDALKLDEEEIKIINKQTVFPKDLLLPDDIGKLKTALKNLNLVRQILDRETSPENTNDEEEKDEEDDKDHMLKCKTCNKTDCPIHPSKLH